MREIKVTVTLFREREIMPGLRKNTPKPHPKNRFSSCSSWTPAQVQVFIKTCIHMDWCRNIFDRRILQHLGIYQPDKAHQTPLTVAIGKYRLPKWSSVCARENTVCVSENAHGAEELPGSSGFGIWKNTEGHSRTALLSPAITSTPVRRTEYGRYWWTTTRLTSNLFPACGRKANAQPRPQARRLCQTKVRTLTHFKGVSSIAASWDSTHHCIFQC